MEVKIVFNNDVLNRTFAEGWGFSCLVDDRILFDTGEDAASLFLNMENLHIDIAAIKDVVISHDHWDHTGGLWELLRKNRKMNVWSCPGFSRKFKDQVKNEGIILREESECAQVSEGMYVTGEIAGQYKNGYMPEQALTVKTDSGLTVITGCSHPGIIEIVERVKDNFPKETINLVFGGFHLLDKDHESIRMIAGRLRDMGVRNVGPTHCTGLPAQMVFKKLYGDGYRDIRTGQVFAL